MLELFAVSGMVLLVIICLLLLCQIRAARRHLPTGVAERLQSLADGLFTLQRTLDARIEHAGQATAITLVTGLTQLSTQLVSRLDAVRLESQLALDERRQAVHRELRQQHEASRVSVQEALAGGRRELFGMVTTLQQGVEQRLSENMAQHSTLFRLPPLTLDFTIMFIPAENVYYEILLSEEVLAFGREKRVVPVSPNTLYAYLQAIAIGFRGLKIAQETRRIEQLLLGLKKNFDEFKEHFRLIGKHLDRARGQFIQAETDVSRFDHAIGGIQFGMPNDQLPAPEDDGSRASDNGAAP